MTDFIEAEPTPEKHRSHLELKNTLYDVNPIVSEQEDPKAPGDQGTGSRVTPLSYDADSSGLYLIRRVPKRHGRGTNSTPYVELTKTQLTNFLAVIVGQRIIDDGDGDGNVRREYLMKATVGEMGWSFSISADQFSEVRRWMETYVGAPATIVPSVHNCLDHVLAAIKTISGIPPTTYVRTHTGWLTASDAIGFLHQGGLISPTKLDQSREESLSSDSTNRPSASIGPDSIYVSAGPNGPFFGSQQGLISYETELPIKLRYFDLPHPLTGDNLKSGFKAVCELVSAAPAEVGVSLLGSCFSAPLGGSRTYVNLIGATDSGKSVFAGLFQSFYGPKLDAKNLPAHWGSSANFLERFLYHAKDVMIVIDDFVTKGHSGDVQRQQAKADQVLRSLFNNTGRGRAQGNGEIRENKPPRAQVVCTAELPFDGQSIKNRGFNLDFQRKVLDWEAVTSAQSHARLGVFAGVMSSFLHHVTDHVSKFQSWRCQREDELEKLARNELIGRGRAASVVASLAIGVEAFYVYAFRVGCITKDELNTYLYNGWTALLSAARSQSLEQDNPVEFYFMCLQTALISGRAHLMDRDGGCPNREGDGPTDPEAWGWHRYSTADSVETANEADDSASTRAVAATTVWRSKGDVIGWLDGTVLYLHPGASLKAAKGIARAIDSTIDFTPWTLGKSLYEQGLLLRSERKRKRYTARENLGGGRPNVLIVNSSNVMPPKSQFPAECRLYDCEDDELPEVYKSFEALLA